MGRDIAVCHPRLQSMAKKLVEECAAKGLKIKITDCFRSKEEQDSLYAQGRTKPGNIVTDAPGSTYSSMHMWGVAFDICRNDGRGAYYDNDGFFTKVGAIGKSLGLEWGGNWKSPVDKPHFQLADWGSTPTKLKQMYGTPDRFKQTWSSGGAVADEEGYAMVTIRNRSRGKAVQIWQIIVGVAADGIFGANTEAATRNFQANHGLVVDGIVGKNSWKAGFDSI